ncbi:hypothetical protein BDW68DRAFT_184375 [Aspergillus falconensis]
MSLSRSLQPLTVIPWGALAMWYLDVPIAVGALIVAVLGDDLHRCYQNAWEHRIPPKFPNHGPLFEIIENYPNPQQILEEINAGYKRLDQSYAVFDYLYGDPAEKSLQVYISPHSFIRETALAKQSIIYSNLHYPLEQALVESFVKAVIDEETDTGFSAWCAIEVIGISASRIPRGW